MRWPMPADWFGYELAAKGEGDAADAEPSGAGCPG
jgi:hypothetical protein